MKGFSKMNLTVCGNKYFEIGLRKTFFLHLLIRTLFFSMFEMELSDL